MFGRCRSMTIRSACLPGASTSQSVRPMACAPPTVAMCSTSSAGRAAASPQRSFCSTAARYISRKKSSALLLDGPSVPMAMRMPSSRICRSGAMPLASLAFEPGFVMTQSPRARKMSRSRSVMCTQWKPPPPKSKWPRLSNSSVGVLPQRARHSATSRAVSALCANTGARSVRASSPASVISARLEVYSECRPS